MKHFALAAAVFIAALAFGLGPASAREAPWCAVISMGWGSVHWDCRYNSIEECRPNVLAGNRGYCNHNPRYEGGYVSSKPRKKRHVRRH
jgi:hypothetical protein